MCVSWKLYELLMSHKFNRLTNVKWFGCGISDAVLTALIRSIRGGSFGRGDIGRDKGHLRQGRTGLDLGVPLELSGVRGNVISSRRGEEPRRVRRLLM